MEPACIRHTDLPGSTKLFNDFSYHFDRVARFYRHDPHQPASFAAAARAIDYPDSRRAAMVAALEAQNGPSASLRKLAEPGTVAVVTGQQVGLFCGPAYTIYKALTAVRLARELSAQGIPAVPIFWLASEDHDFAEVSYVHSFDSARRPVRFEIQAPEGANGRPRPVGPLRVEHPPLMELRESLKDFPYRAEVAAMVEESYAPGATLTQAFRKLLGKILGEMELLTLDPLDPAIRTIARPFLEAALRAAPDVKTALLERGRELTSAGYHVQVLVEPKSSLFSCSRTGSGRRCARRMPSSRRLRIERRRFRQTHCCVR